MSCRRSYNQWQWSVIWRHLDRPYPQKPLHGFFNRKYEIREGGWRVVIWEDLLLDLTSQLSKYRDVSYDRPKAKKGSLNVARRSTYSLNIASNCSSLYGEAYKVKQNIA